LERLDPEGQDKNTVNGLVLLAQGIGREPRWRLVRIAGERVCRRPDNRKVVPFEDGRGDSWRIW